MGLNDAVEAANKTRLAREAASQASKFLRRGGEVAIKANERIVSARKAVEALPAELRAQYKELIGDLPEAVVVPPSAS